MVTVVVSVKDIEAARESVRLVESVSSKVTLVVIEKVPVTCVTVIGPVGVWVSLKLIGGRVLERSFVSLLV